MAPTRSPPATWPTASFELRTPGDSVSEAFDADSPALGTTEADVRALNAALERRTSQLEVALSNLQAQNSQRTHAEAALRESELRYRRLVELSPESILVIA